MSEKKTAKKTEKKTANGMEIAKSAEKKQEQEQKANRLKKKEGIGTKQTSESKTFTKDSRISKKTKGITGKGCANLAEPHNSDDDFVFNCGPVRIKIVVTDLSDVLEQDVENVSLLDGVRKVEYYVRSRLF